MREDDKNHIIRRYNKRLKEYGYDPRTLGWTKGKQDIRFRTLTQIGDLSGLKILDVGCGFGDLYGFLKREKITCDYTGIDLNKKLISIGKKKYPGADLIVADFDELSDSEYDWIICSGMFNHSATSSLPFIKRSLKKMFLMCRRGIAVDFISTYVNCRHKDVHYTRPETMFRFAKSLSRRVSLRHDYLPFEFSVYIYRKDNYNENTEFCE